MIKISKEQKSWDVHGVPMSAHPKMFGQSSLRDHKNGGQLFFMSNMYPCHITYKGYEYECAEAAIQAQKYPGHEKEFKKLLYGAAKSYGRKYRARGDWRDISLDVLLGVVRAKFQQNHNIATQLVQFQGTIVELNSWGDDFYGVVKDPRQPNVAIGSNCLGQALTIVRNELIAAGVNTANTDGATTSGTSIPEASKDTSMTEAKNKVSKEETKMLLRNKEELLSAFGQKPIPATDQIENGIIVARGEGLTRGLIETENGIAKRNGVTPEILATLDDPTAQYVFDGKNIVVKALGKSVARYTGNVKLSESAARPKTTKGFFGAVFKVVTDGGLQLTEDKVIAVDSESKDVYAVKTTDGFDFSNFISGDETGFKITKEGIEAWLEVAGEGELFAVTFNGPQQPAPAPAPAPEPETPEPAPAPAPEPETPEPAPAPETSAETVETPTHGFFDGEDYDENLGPQIFEEATTEEVVEEVTEKEIEQLASLHIVQDANKDANSLDARCRQRWHETLVFFVRYFKTIGITPQEAAQALGRFKLRKSKSGDVVAFNSRDAITREFAITFYRKDTTVKCRIGQ